eukprot:130639-Pyramimonas_sp.AAC.1
MGLDSVAVELTVTTYYAASSLENSILPPILYGRHSRIRIVSALFISLLDRRRCARIERTPSRTRQANRVNGRGGATRRTAAAQFT